MTVFKKVKEEYVHKCRENKSPCLRLPMHSPTHTQTLASSHFSQSLSIASSHSHVSAHSHHSMVPGSFSHFCIHISHTHTAVQRSCVSHNNAKSFAIAASMACSVFSICRSCASVKFCFRVCVDCLTGSQRGRAKNRNRVGCCLKPTPVYP